MSPFAQSAFITAQQHRTRSHSLNLFASTHTAGINLVAFSVLIVLCVTYIVQVNSVASKGFKIRELETRIQELTILNQRTELQTQEAQSLQNITHAVKMIGMVKAEQPIYVGVGKPTYAFAK